MDREPEARVPAEPAAFASPAQARQTSTLGARLRAERLRQGLSFEAIEAQTHVRSRFLQAIEEGRWESLPGPVYARGFLKLYALAVGLDPASVLKEYEAEVAGSSSASRPASRPAAPRGRVADGGPPGRQRPRRPRDGLPVSAWWSLPDPLLRALEPARRIRTASLLAVLVVGGAVTGTWLLSRPLQPPRPSLPSLGALPPGAATTPDSLQPASGGLPDGGGNLEAPGETVPEVAVPSIPEPPPTPPGPERPAGGADGQVAAARPPRSAEGPASGPTASAAALGQESVAAGGSPEGALRLTARVRERSWMEVYADGRLVFSRSAQPGEVLSWEAREVLSVRFGRPEVVDLNLNGVELGRAGTGVITRVFTAQAARDSRPAAGGSLAPDAGPATR